MGSAGAAIPCHQLTGGGAGLSLSQGPAALLLLPVLAQGSKNTGSLGEGRVFVCNKWSQGLISWKNPQCDVVFKISGG